MPQGPPLPTAWDSQQCSWLEFKLATVNLQYHILTIIPQGNLHDLQIIASIDLQIYSFTRAGLITGVKFGGVGLDVNVGLPFGILFLRLKHHFRILLDKKLTSTLIYRPCGAQIAFFLTFKRLCCIGVIDTSITCMCFQSKLYVLSV